MPDIDISFITVNYRTPELVARLLDSLKHTPPTASYEIIVIDNASNDGIEKLIEVKYPDVKFLGLPKNIGFGAGNNRGAKIAHGRILALINSDCEVTEESFDKPSEYLKQHPEIGILGLKVYTPEGTIEQSARGFPNPSTGIFGRSTALGKLAQRGKLGKLDVAKRNLQVDPDATEPYPVDWVAGTMMLISRECWDKIGGFDEDYFMYWEDADICQRALQAGFKTVYYPAANVIHRPGSSTSGDPVPSIKWFHQSAYLYVRKNISPGWSFVRMFAWLALNLRASMKIAKAKAAKKQNK
jgi:GT2 family glycosyltransferase